MVNWPFLSRLFNNAGADVPAPRHPPRLDAIPPRPPAQDVPQTRLRKGAEALSDRARMSVSFGTRGRLKRAARAAVDTEPFAIPKPMPGVVPDNAAGLAYDDIGLLGAADWSNNSIGGNSYFNEGLSFLGYPYLAQLAQRPEYRHIVEIRSKELTRKFVRITAPGESNLADKVAELSAAFVLFDVRNVFRRAADCDGYFGRGHIFLDFGDNTDDDAGMNEVQTMLILDPAKINPDKPLIGLKVIEPQWAYPYRYNSINPLAPDFYNPASWYVMSKAVHRTRFLTFVSHPVTDLLKAQYAFGGMSLTQMAKPYVDNWLRTRQSVSDIVHSFSLTILKTNMNDTLTGGEGDDIDERLDLFNATRDNRGAMAIDMELEDIIQVNTPLGTLDKLQAQAQEQMSSVSLTPLVKLLGITPSGLNASSDGEIRVFYDYIAAEYENFFAAPLKYVSQIIQLSLWGKIEEDIDCVFEPLWELDSAAKATQKKTEADTATVYIQAGVIAPIEERQRLANADGSNYNNLDLNMIPDPPDAAPPPGDPSDPAAKDDPENGGGPQSSGGAAEDSALMADRLYDALSEADKFTVDGMLAADADDFAFDADTDWKEHLHPRAPDGKFGSGGSTKTKEMKAHLLANPHPTDKAYYAKKVAQADKLMHGPDAIEKLDALNQSNKNKFPKWHAYVDSLIADLKSGMTAEKAIEKEAPKAEAAKAETPAPKPAPVTGALNEASAKTNEKYKMLHDKLVSGNMTDAAKDQLKKIADAWMSADVYGNPQSDLNIPKVADSDDFKGDEAQELNALLESIQVDYGVAPGHNIKAPEPAPEPPPAPPKEAPLSDQTMGMAATIAQHMPNVIAANKPTAESKMGEIEAALSPFDPAKLAAVLPIPNPQGMMQGSINTYLSNAQQDAGVPVSKTPPPPPVSAKTFAEKAASALNAKQKAAAASMNHAPHIESESTIKATIAGGAKAKIKLSVNTNEIPEGFLGLATAAYAGDQHHSPDGEAHTKSVDPVMQNYAEHVATKLNHAEKSIVSSYQGSSTDINGYAGKLKHYGEPSASWKAKIAAMQSAIEKSIVPADTPVYRGMNISLKDLTGFDNAADAVGKAFIHKPFASVSRSRSKARNFSDGKMLIKTTVPAGAKGFVMENQAWEREIVLGLNSSFKITKVESNAEGHETVIHCDYLGHLANE